MSVRFEKNIANEIFRINSLNRFFFIMLLSFFLGACATNYQKTALQSWDLMAQGQADRALSMYEKDVTSEPDSLLKLMDEGILLRVAGRYKESNQKFMEAANVIELAGYALASEEIVGMLANEKRSIYQGEDFEKVLIHAFMALNFIALKDWDSALVAARKVNEVLYIMMSEGGRPYEWNSFAKYLTGLLYEQDREFNDAYISYKQINEAEPDLVKTFPTLKIDLLRGALRMGFGEEVEQFRESFGGKAFEDAKNSLKQKQASVVFLLETGKSPQKYSSEESHKGEEKGAENLLLAVPRYQSRSSEIQSAKIFVANQSAVTACLNDIEKTAFAHLNDRMTRYITKALLRAATKVGVAAGVGALTNSEDLGVLTGLLLFAVSGADTRSWLLLPQKLQVARIFLPEGTYSLKIQYLDRSGENLSTEKINDIRLKSNQVYFLQRRTFL